MISGSHPGTDKNNIQPRLGFAYDVKGNAHDVVRGGWGIYTDFAYTNQNALNAAIDAAGGIGIVFQAVNPTGLRKPDGSLFLASDPLSTIASLNTVNTSLPPLGGQVQSPRLEQPYTRQANIGWAHQLNPATALTADYVRVDGRDLNTRLRVNTLVNGRRNLADLAIQPNSIAFRTAISKGESLYDALIVGVNRRMSHRLDLSASYTLASSTSNIGSASDETDANLVQDVRDPFGPVQDAPSTRTDARHRVSLSAIVEGPAGINIAPIFLYRSALPTHTFEGLDLNADGNVNDKTATAYRYTGLNADGTATFKEDGAVRHGQLQPARAVLAVEPARQPGVPRRRLGARRGDRRGVQPVQREEPVHPADDAPPQRRRRAALVVHAADRIRGRFPAARAARRSGGIPHHVLI